MPIRFWKIVLSRREKATYVVGIIRNRYQLCIQRIFLCRRSRYPLREHEVAHFNEESNDKLPQYDKSSDYDADDCYSNEHDIHSNPPAKSEEEEDEEEDEEAFVLVVVVFSCEFVFVSVFVSVLVFVLVSVFVSGAPRLANKIAPPSFFLSLLISI